MKKKILLTLAFFATLTLVACGKKNITPTTTTDNTTTTSSNNNNDPIVVDEHYRGELDNSIPNVKLPDVIIKDKEKSYEATDESISLGNGDYIETNAGSGKSETVEGSKYVTATVNIGYEFLGWFDGDKLISSELKYKCNEGEENIVAKFQLKEGFEYFEFTSNETECTITGLKDEYPAMLNVPEGVTEIADYAFKSSDVVNVTLPESLEAIGNCVLADCMELTSLTFKAMPEEVGYSIAEYSSLRCVFIPNDFNDYSALRNILDSYYADFYIKSTDTDFYINDGFVFNLDEDDWYLVTYIGKDKEITLPNATDLISEYYIDYHAFVYSRLRKVTLSSAVKSICSEAFYYSYIEEIDLGSSITSIGNEAFYDCDNLKEVVIPDSVTYINSSAFYDCDNLSSVTLGKSVETISDEAFYGCDKLYYIYNYSDLTLEKGSYNNGYVAYYAYEIIGGNEENPTIKEKDGFIYSEYEGDDYVTLLSYVGNSKDIVIPTFGTKEICLGEEIFSGNDVIETVTFNEYCVEINSYAFSNCDNLKKVNTGGVTDIYSSAFYDCDNLVEVIMPNVTYLSSEVFIYCSELKTVVSPKLVDLGSQSFYGCYKLESIDLENVEGISSQTFYNCYALKEAIMNKAEYIENNAFYNCYKLEKAIMPKATSIGDYAFNNCHKLRTIDISSVSSLGNYAFYRDYSLISITIPATLTAISNTYTFYQCSNIVEVVNYSSMDLKAGYGGNGYLCSGAKSVITDPSDSILSYKDNLITYINSDNEKVLVGIVDRTAKKVVIPSDIDIVWVNALYGCDELEDLEVKQLPEYTGYLGYYFGAYYEAYNSSYAYSSNNEYVPKTLKTIRFGESVEYISRYALYSCYSIENIYIGKNVRSIYNDAFYGIKLKNIYFDGTIKDWCNIEFDSIEKNPLYYGGNILFKDGDTYSELDVVEVPNTVDYIGDYQFYRFNMTKVILPEGLTYIGEKAFSDCYKLKEIIIKEGLVTIGAYAFSNSLLKSIVLPNSLETIGTSAFEYCYNLISVKLGNSVTSIGDYAFSDCRLLYNFNAPDTLEYLGSGVFAGCEILEEITLEDTAVTELRDYLFADCVNLESFGFPTGLTAIDSTTFLNCDKLEFRTWKNGCYFGTAENPYRWLIKARAKTILECIVHNDCEKIYDGAFSGCKNLKKIVIPSTCVDWNMCLAGLTNVEYIEAPYTGSKTFAEGLFGVANANLTWVKTIVINGGAIANNAFKGLPGDISIILDGNITSVGQYAFSGTNITEFIAPASLTTIGNYAFQNCILLENVDLGSITTLGTYAFSGCSALASVIFSNSLTAIPNYAFKNCSSLTALNLRYSITSIGEKAFENSGVEHVNYINGSTTKNDSFGRVETIGTYAFTGSAIKVVKITSTVRTLGTYAFYNCLSLTTASTGDYRCNSYDNTDNTLPTSIFEGCTALTSYESTLDTYYSFNIGQNAFKGCTNLKTATFNSLSSIKTSAFENSGIESISHDINSSSGTYTITIYSYAFKNCANLTTVSFTSTKGATLKISLKNGFTDKSTESLNIFEGCSSLKIVKFPNTLTTINDSMFKDCTSLNSFDFSNVTEIHQYAFQNTGFTYLELPEKITTLQRYIFDKCANLESVVVGCKLMTGMFRDCVKLESVTLSGIDDKVWAQAFYRCPLLKSIELNEGITEIGNYAFAESGLTKIVIPSTVTIFGNNVFDGCALETVTIPGKITTFGDYVFQNNTNLKSVVIEEGITGIPSNMFKGCTALETVELPSSLTTIGSNAFNGCSSLSSIVIPKGVTSIGSNAFKDCDNLNTVYNYSNLVLETGSINNGYVAYNADNIITLYSGETFYVDENVYSFAKIDDKYYLISYNDEEEVITLPTTFKDNNNEDVTEYRIYNSAFFGKTSIKKVIIPASVKEIGDYAFARCTNLAEIYNYSELELTKGSKENGYVAYYATTITTPYNDPDNMVEDENGFVFAYVDDKGYLVGYKGTNAKVVLPDSFTFGETLVEEYEIYKNAFYGNLNILSITISASVTAIGENAFKECYKLLEVYNLADPSLINDGYLSNYAFATHSDLLEDSIFITDENGFVFTFYEEGKAVLVGYTGTNSEITIPTSLDYNEEEITDIVIGDYAFVNSNITKVTIPASIYAIGIYAFMDSKLKEVVVEDATRGLGHDMFKNCKIEKATISSDMIKFVNYYDAKNSSLKELIITSGTEIEANALRELLLKKVTLPDTITKIGAYAFYKCAKLKEIDLPSSLSILGENAFNGCSSIVSVVIPETLSTISYRAFYNCGRLLFIYIPNPEVVIENEAFYKTSREDRVKVLCDGSEADFEDFEIDVFNNGDILAQKCFYRASAPSSDADKEVYWHLDANGKPITYRYEELKGYYDLLIPELKNELLKAKNGENGSNVSTSSGDYNYKIIKTGENYTITVKAYFAFCYKGYGTVSHDVYWGMTHDYSSNLVVGLDSEGNYYLEDENAVTYIYGYDFYCDLEDYMN